MENYHLTADNIYNMDEKGFLIGIGSAIKRIMSKEAYISGQIQQAIQDGSREFITLLAYVSAIGQAGIPTLLYKGDSGDLQDSWVEDLGDTEQAYFGSFENGWSNKAFGLRWLQEVFEPNTRPVSPRTWRLLIVDGHSSHINLQFIDWALGHKILILALPPHSTHRLQPLDASLFQTLATKYQVQMNHWMHKSLGEVKLGKRHFWRLFWPAYQKAFLDNAEGIQGSFRRTGIWPINPGIIMEVVNRHLQPSTPPEQPLNILPLASKTPMTSKAVRRLQRAYEKDPQPYLWEKLKRLQQALVAQHEIDEHKMQGLYETLKEEKKRRCKGKRLNLLNEEGGKAQLYDADKVRRAKEIAREKANKEAQQDADKQLKKEENIARKLQDAKDKKDRAIQRHEDKVAKARKAQLELVEKEARKERFRTLVQGELPIFIVILKVKFTPKPSNNTISCSGSSNKVGNNKGVISRNSRTRAINLPMRFQDSLN